MSLMLAHGIPASPAHPQGLPGVTERSMRISDDDRAEIVPDETTMTMAGDAPLRVR